MNFRQRTFVRSGLICASLVAPLTLTNAWAAGPDRFGFAPDANFQLTPGRTYLNFMQEIVKPRIDRFAREGYKLKDPAAIDQAFSNVVPKVVNNATTRIVNRQRVQVLSKNDVLQLVNQVATKQKAEAPAVSRFDTFDDELRALNPRLDFRLAGNLSTFLGLASGGGVAVTINPENIYYNIHYGTGDNKDQRVPFVRPDGTPVLRPDGTPVMVTKPGDVVTGRSFGQGPGRLANDVSDPEYLGELEKLLTTTSDKRVLAEFYRTLMMILTNCDASNYARLPPGAQVVATDFTAVYTAEQDRHLMENLEKFEFDVALAEVTFISAFSAGGSKIRVEFMGRLLEGQIPNIDPDTKEVLTTFHPASLEDWSRKSMIPCRAKTDPPGTPSRPGCNRSGPNVTKADRRKLMNDLFKLLRTDRRFAPTFLPLIQAVEAQLLNYTQVTGRRLGFDPLFQEITNYLISKRAINPLPQANNLSTSFANFMLALMTNADPIAAALLQAQPVEGSPQATQAAVVTQQQMRTDPELPPTTPEINPTDDDDMDSRIVDFFRNLFRRNR